MYIATEVLDGGSELLRNSNRTTSEMMVGNIMPSFRDLTVLSFWFAKQEKVNFFMDYTSVRNSAPIRLPLALAMVFEVRIRKRKLSSSITCR